MKNAARVLLLTLLCGMLTVLGGGLALNLYYRNSFPVNTWINGIYCTGKTVEEVNEELAARTVPEEIVIVELSGSRWSVSPESVALTPDYRSALKAYLRQYATFFWTNYLSGQEVCLTEAGYGFDEEKLTESFDGLDFVREENGRAGGCQVRYDEEKGYFLIDGNRERLNRDQALRYIMDCVAEGRLQIDLKEGGCYEDRADSPRDVDQRRLWEKLQAFFDCGIIYDMGAEQIPLTPAILSAFLKKDAEGKPLTDQNGALTADEALVEKWLEALAKSYNTCGTEREFRSTRGDVIRVRYVAYGTELDVKAEKEYLVRALGEERPQMELHVPAYRKKGFVRGLDDIGDTYIEVDMTLQHMYYYLAGELALDTDIVTGNTGRRMGTPEGINFVYAKQRNRVLRGADYATPVKYWMPVKGGIGIHDAGWRREFGGEIYRQNGSHGCINVPPDVMPKLYDMVEIGTPVIMFY